MSNDIRLSERINPEVNSPKTKAQELLTNLAVNCLQNQASGNVTATASLAILQAIAMLIVDEQNEIIQKKCKHDNIHEAMKFARCLLEGKSDLIGNKIAILHNIWLRNGLKLNKKVQNLLATHYSCETKVLPLANNNIDVPKLKKKLRKLDQPGRFHEEFRTAVFHSISPQDIFLTSAVYIEMAWREPFLENLTTKGTFHISGEERIETDTMVTKCGLVCVSCEDINATVLQLPLTAHNISMLVYLPYNKTKDLDAILTKFTSEIFGKLVTKIGKSKPKPVYVSLPKFTLKQSGVLSANLYKTTETKTSQSEADLTPGCKIFQTTTLRVDEYGLNTTKPRTGQEDTMAGPAVHDGIKWTNFIASSPFLFMLVDMEYKLIFLTGKVTRPEQASEVKRRKSGRKQNRDWCCL